MQGAQYRMDRPLRRSRWTLAYVEAIHAAMSRNYAPLAAGFAKVIRRTSISFGVPL